MSFDSVNHVTIETCKRAAIKWATHCVYVFLNYHVYMKLYTTQKKNTIHPSLSLTIILRACTYIHLDIHLQKRINDSSSNWLAFLRGHHHFCYSIWDILLDVALLLSVSHKRSYFQNHGSIFFLLLFPMFADCIKYWHSNWIFNLLC